MSELSAYHPNSPEYPSITPMNGPGGGFMSGAHKTHIPGEFGIWIFIFGDMTSYAALFTNYMYYRGKDVDLFEASQATLNLNCGAINTLILLLSSLLVALAVMRLRKQLVGPARPLIGGAICCGLAFSTLKVIEYYHKLSHHITPTTNQFFTYYFVLTGLHWLHLIIGLAVLTRLFKLAGKSDLTANEISLIEVGASYWHMVDLIWIVLFPLLYLVK